MTKDEALKLALEALKWSKPREGAEITHSEAIAALEEVLAQPAQEPVGYEHHEYRPFGAPGEIRIHAILASQYMMPDGSVAGDFQFLADAYKADKNTIKLVPLYTTPPQRKPLTDEQIEAIWREGPYSEGLLYEFNLFARAIEAAHGIKKNT